MDEEAARTLSGGAAGETDAARPSWSMDELALIYGAGHNTDRIAQMCDLPAGKVMRLITRARQLDPELQDRHLANAPETAPELPADGLTPQWTAQCQALEQFIREHGRLPFVKRPDEAVLGRWLSRQRAAALRGTLTLQRRRALDAAGPWETTAEGQEDQKRWEQRLLALTGFVDSEDRFPAYRKPRSETERLLGTWLHRQRQDDSRGALEPRRREALDGAVPGWNTWRPRGQR